MDDVISGRSPLLLIQRLNTLYTLFRVSLFNDDYVTSVSARCETGSNYELYGNWFSAQTNMRVVYNATQRDATQRDATQRSAYFNTRYTTTTTKERKEKKKTSMNNLLNLINTLSLHIVYISAITREYTG